MGAEAGAGLFQGRSHMQHAQAQWHRALGRQRVCTVPHGRAIVGASRCVERDHIPKCKQSHNAAFWERGRGIHKVYKLWAVIADVLVADGECPHGLQNWQGGKKVACELQMDTLPHGVGICKGRNCSRSTVHSRHKAAIDVL